MKHSYLYYINKLSTVKAAYNEGGKSASSFRNIEIIRYRYLLYKHPYMSPTKYLPPSYPPYPPTLPPNQSLKSLCFKPFIWRFKSFLSWILSIRLKFGSTESEVCCFSYSFIVQPGPFDTDNFTSDEAVERITVGLLPPATAGLQFEAPHWDLIRVIIVPGP